MVFFVILGSFTNLRRSPPLFFGNIFWICYLCILDFDQRYPVIIVITIILIKLVVQSIITKKNSLSSQKLKKRLFEHVSQRFKMNLQEHYTRIAITQLQSIYVTESSNVTFHIRMIDFDDYSKQHYLKKLICKEKRSWLTKLGLSIYNLFENGRFSRPLSLQRKINNSQRKSVLSYL